MSTQSSPKLGGSVERRTRTSSKSDVPFYETPTGVATSSQIIKEAKEKLHDAKKSNLKFVQDAGGAGRTLNATRPFTPREEKRTLFGPKSTRALNERPPSSFCIGSKSFDSDSASRPMSATRLSPIEKLNSSRPSSGNHLNLEEESSAGEKTDRSELLRLTSPKSVKSRLAPLEVPLNKPPSAKANEAKAKMASTISKPSTASKFNSASTIVTTPTTTVPSTSGAEDEANWKNHIEPVMNLMNMCLKDNHIDQFCDNCDKLNKLLDQFQMYTKASSKRSIILKQIFKYLDTDCDRVKIRVSKIILNMKVGGNNLTNICRLLFSISRNTENDSFFMENDIIDSMLNSSRRLDFKENSDSVVYFCGTIKNLSENNKLLKLLSAKNVEEFQIKIIKDLSKHYKDNETLKSEAGHALVQLTAALRNLADLNNTRQKFISLNLIEHLVYILKYYTGDAELMLNVSRILSKLTLHADCSSELVRQDSCYKSFIKIMIKHDSKQDLIVRIGFVLGNITARHEDARTKFLNEKYSVDTLTNTLKIYFNNDLQQIRKESKKLNNSNGQVSSSKLNDIEEHEPNPNEDVMIKLVRVIANLAINEKAGTLLANKQDLFDVLLKILETKDLACEELVIDSIVTINNISFYNSDLIINYSQKIIDCLIKYLLSNNPDAVLEVFRVLANLCRDQSVRNYLVLRKINILTVAYLNSPNRELVYIVIGVLINLMTDNENRVVLKEEKGVKKLIDILNETGPSDWQLSSMICKVLMNYSDKSKTPGSNFVYFDVDEIKILRVILTELLDEKFALRDGSDETKSTSDAVEDEEENINEYMNYLWKQDFSPVASLFLKRIVEEF